MGGQDLHWKPLRAGIGMGNIEEDPETRKAKVRQQVEGWYKDGMKARAAGNLADAVKFLLWAAKTRCDTEYPELAFNELKVISEDAKKELEVARQLAGGEDPAAYIRKLAGRAPQIHLKDMDPADGSFTEVGAGLMDLPGIFAAGDVRFGSAKRVAAAVGEGSAAVGMVHKYLETV